MDEIYLVNSAKAGNREDLNLLLSNNLTILKGYVIKMTMDPNLSQDIVQETLLKAVLNLDKFEPNAKFSTWLIRIAINVYRDYLRRNKQLEEINEDYMDVSRGPEDTAISKLQHSQVMEVIKKLPFEKKSVFILKHFYGYKYEEIASMVGCPTGTVRSRLHNAVKTIIKELEERGFYNEGF